MTARIFYEGDPSGGRPFSDSAHPDRYGLGLPSVTEILGDLGHGSDFTFADPAAVERKARIGSAVHDAISATLRCRLVRYEEAFGGDDGDAARGYYESWILLLAALEIPCCSSLGETWVEHRVTWPRRAVGTLDYAGPAGAARRRRPVIIDWKCRDVSVSDLLQPAGYRAMALRDTDSRLREIARDAEVGVVGLREDGFLPRVIWESQGSGSLDAEWERCVRGWWDRSSQD